jgi:hypothetical protein
MARRLKIKATGAHFDPPQGVVAEGDVREIAADVALELGPEQVPVNPTCTLRDYETREEIEGGALLDEPAIDGTVIFVRVAEFERDHAYELRIGWDHEPPRVEGEHSERIFIIECLA